MKWEELPLADRAKLMAAAVRNGYTDIRSIKEAYANYLNLKQPASNKYAKGGDTDEPEVVNLLDELPIWKALEKIDYTAIPDPEFTREKTGAGSIEYFSAEEPEGITYNNNYHRDHPMPGHDVILYDPNTNDEQDIRLDALHIMPKDPTYDVLNSLYRAESLDALDDNYYNAWIDWRADRGAQTLNNTIERALYGPKANEYVEVDPFEQYFNNEADGLLRNMFVEGTPEYIESKRYHQNKDELRQWNAHLMPYINRIEQYLKTGERPTDILPELVVTNLNGYGGNLFDGVSGTSRMKKKARLSKGGLGISDYERKKAAYYRNELIKRGITNPVHLDAIIANMAVESTFNPGAADGTGAHGLMQWMGARIPKDMSEKGQLDYIARTYNHFGGNDWLNKEAYKRFNTTNDPVEAANLMRIYWERCAPKYHYKAGAWLNLYNNDNNKTIDTYHPMEDVTWNDVQSRKKQFKLTPEEERLLNTTALTAFNPEYIDRDSPDYEESALMQSVKLNPELDKPVNNWAIYNMFTNMQQDSSQDNSDWFNALVASSPKTTPEQKEAANWLFNMAGDGGQLYHGLNFAAYGEKVNKFGDGGFSDLPEQRAYRRAVNLKAPYTNYEDAVDMDDSIMLKLKKFFDKGVSNCTLTASQLFNPNNPIGRARTIVNDSINNGFYEIDAEHVVPGTMVIASHPNMSDYNPKLNYHTMIVTGFAPNDYEYTFRDGTKYQIKKGEPLVSYSRGKASADNYVHDVPLSVYNANSEGKIYNRYYRPIDENYPQVMLDNVEIVANKKGKGLGGHLFGDGSMLLKQNAINPALQYVYGENYEDVIKRRRNWRPTVRSNYSKDERVYSTKQQADVVANTTRLTQKKIRQKQIDSPTRRAEEQRKADAAYWQSVREKQGNIGPVVDGTRHPDYDPVKANQVQVLREKEAEENQNAYFRRVAEHNVAEGMEAIPWPSTVVGSLFNPNTHWYNPGSFFANLYANDNRGFFNFNQATRDFYDANPEVDVLNLIGDFIVPGAAAKALKGIGKIPKVSRNLVASSAINYGAKTRSLPTNIYKSRNLFINGPEGKWIKDSDPFVEFINSKRGVPDNTSFFLRTPRDINILKLRNGRYRAKAEGNIIVPSGSVDGKFVSYGEPWMEFGTNDLAAWYEFPTSTWASSKKVGGRGPYRTATDWRGNEMDYDVTEAWRNMMLRQDPKFIAEEKAMYENLRAQKFNSSQERVQAHKAARKAFYEKWGYNPDIDLDVYHGNQTVIPSNRWNFNSEYPRGFLSQPFWRYTQDPYSGAVQKELMMNWETPMKALDRTYVDIVPFIDPETVKWDYLTDFKVSNKSK